MKFSLSIFMKTLAGMFAAGLFGTIAFYGVGHLVGLELDQAQHTAMFLTVTLGTAIAGLFGIAGYFFGPEIFQYWH